MLSSSEIKHLRSLHSPHVAKKEGVFVAEGSRMVAELLEAGVPTEKLYVVGTEYYTNRRDVTYITKGEMKRISQWESPSMVLGVFHRSESTLQPLGQGRSLYLENVQDPGNLGTIIRTAAWFGFLQVICSEDSVNLYNQKVLQATMGALSYISVVYCPFEQLEIPQEVSLVATCLNGEPLHSTSLPPTALYLFGNEGRGLSQELLSRASMHITIPKGKGGAGESLNIASAVAIVCAASV